MESQGLVRLRQHVRLRGVATILTVGPSPRTLGVQRGMLKAALWMDVHRRAVHRTCVSTCYPRKIVYSPSLPLQGDGPAQRARKL